ncbi:MAG: beta-ketoacyl synthase [Gammaproteobacteria bacterium]|nr:beta-ketoacyl synthase [Gammaproteobacteria bacterium]MDP2141955.1 beta-ketoacyl synthase [Gammaproteobacteria bacterium]MDP2347163.1 beta-ketoacyl synthase [Gammaproteobacteria bacterium]
MSKLPVIIGLGGVNPAGRSSSHHGYRRLLLDVLGEQDALATRASLASLMGLLRKAGGQWSDGQGNPIELASYLRSIDPALKAGTLIRRLEDNLFDPANVLFHKRATLNADPDKPFSFLIRKQHLPDAIPLDWQLSEHGEGQVKVDVHGTMDVLTENYQRSTVNSAGQLPTGFDPKDLYASRNHPRGLQMTIYGASDAIQSLGIDWDTILGHVAPDQISVYAGSCMTQLDYNGNGGLLQARLLGKKVSSKQLPLGFAEMPADFINAYILGNLGTTGTSVAACATFLYNLRQGIRDIQAGTHRIVIVGTSEAPITPEVIEGYATMGALADDEALLALDKHKNLQHPDHARACRPFGDNVGFTLSESAQYVVLCDDDLAIELGANILGSVNDVFVNADGYKKSIASPGVGNYITMAKAAAATRNIIGEEGLRHRSYVHAHGTGTPQNRTTESHIMSMVAGTWKIPRWPVTALKSYIGHSLASSAGDQLACSLGMWQYGIIPGILTTERIADDVYKSNLDFLLQHRDVGVTGMDAVLLNSKGFGGNNATASILAPHVTLKMLEKKHGRNAMSAYAQRNEGVREKAQRYDEAATAGEVGPIYRFDHNVLDGDALELSQSTLQIKGSQKSIDLQVPNPYADMCE